LRHIVHSLKRVARLPSKDRAAVMQVLKKRARKIQCSDRHHRAAQVVSQGNSNDDLSSVSVNNEWRHWVVLCGKDRVAVDDVVGLGKAINVHLEGDNHNMFSVLSRAGKGTRESKNKGEEERGRGCVR